MKLIKLVVGRMYAVYLALAFALSLLIVSVVVFYINQTSREEVERSRRIIRLFRVWMRLFLPSVGCPYRIEGLEKFKKGVNYVVVFNHRSFIDILVSTPSVPDANKTLAKKELARIPIFGSVYKSGSILVDRSSIQSRKKSVEDMKQVLKLGMHLILFPEGTRNKTGQPLRPFYDGAFSVAIETGKPVLPALIYNTGKILPPRPGFFAWPHPIRLEFLDPIDTSGYSLKQTAELKQRVHELMEKRYTSQTR